MTHERINPDDLCHTKAPLSNAAAALECCSFQMLVLSNGGGCFQMRSVLSMDNSGPT
jgi:hypothetical protein